MKAEDARQAAIDKRKKLVDHQIQNLEIKIKEAANRGEFETRAHCVEFPTSRDTGWLLEVIEILKEEGYTVYTFGDCDTYEKVFINWKPEVKPVETPNVEPRPSIEPHIHKLGSWWKVW